MGRTPDPVGCFQSGSNIACHFPRLQPVAANERQRTAISQPTSIPITLSVIKESYPHFWTQALDLTLISRLAWIVILRRYIGTTEDVGFGVLSFPRGRLVLTEQLFHVLPAETVANAYLRLAAASEILLESPGRQDQYLTNTAVYIRSVKRRNDPSIPDSVDTMEWFKSNSHLKLILDLSIENDVTNGRLCFDKDWISLEYAGIISHAFSAAFSDVLLNPSAVLNSISGLGPKDLVQILNWNSANLESWNCKLHIIFASAAQNAPDRLAIESHDGEMTYASLSNMSDEVTETLFRAGAKPGDFIGHCFHLGRYAIVATLAILKAGCVAVPLDPTHPVQRHSYMLRSAKVTMLLSDRYMSSDAISFDVPVISIMKPRLCSEPRYTESVSRQAEEAGDSALVCFTSGSTGKPKGILQTHTGLATMVRALARRLGVSSGSRVSGLHPYVFDVSIMEMFVAFLAGATLCIPRREDMMIPKPIELGAALHLFAVTHVVMSPTMLETLEPYQVPSIKVLMSMGEPLNRRLLNVWGKLKQPQLEFVQLWGSTEASILQSCTGPMNHDDVPRNIGRALSTTCRLWIADMNDPNCLLPVGAVGEILVEGPALASGYLDDEEKSAAVFIPSPNWLQFRCSYPIYRTGDLARLATDGSIVFVGRKDTQMNFHGERVELGEIDYHLKQLCMHGAIDVFSDFIEDRQTIVAFVCLPDIPDQVDMALVGEDTLSRLRCALRGSRERLARDLPAYMIPKLYFPLRVRPTTATGKTDRQSIRRLLEGVPGEILASFEDLDR